MSLSPDHLRLLSQFFLFRNLSPEELPALAAGLTVERYPPGAVIYSRQEFRQAMGVVLEGSLSVLKGKELLLNILGPGQCFGAAAIFCPAEDYVTTVMAKTPSALVFLSGQWLTGLFAQHPASAVAYIAFLSQRIRFLNRKIDSFTAPNAQETLYRHLLAAQQGDAVEVAGGYSQLARALNLGRASLYRALETLEAEGRIRREGKRILLLSPPDASLE